MTTYQYLNISFLDGGCCCTNLFKSQTLQLPHTHKHTLTHTPLVSHCRELLAKCPQPPAQMLKVILTWHIHKLSRRGSGWRVCRWGLWWAGRCCWNAAGVQRGRWGSGRLSIQPRQNLDLSDDLAGWTSGWSQQVHQRRWTAFTLPSSAVCVCVCGERG